MSTFKNYRIDGIMPEEISNEIVYYSNMPGENDDNLIMEVDYHNDQNSRSEEGSGPEYTPSGHNREC